jgi:ATP-binding cassette, subfamily B, bacterial HlyB/CyaB
MSSTPPQPPVPSPEIQPAPSPPPPVDVVGTGCTCLSWVAEHHGLDFSAAELRRGLTDERPQGLRWLQRLARAHELAARPWQGDVAGLAELDGRYPAILRLRNGNFVLLLGRLVRPDGVLLLIRDPLAQPAGLVLQLPAAQVAEAWSGEALVLRRRHALTDESQPFGLTWFVPQLLRERRNFRDLALAAFMLHLLALAIPIFLQLVIDRVVPHEAGSTLFVLTVGVTGALLFEAGFQYLRQYLLLDASQRIDLRLVRTTFARLLSLPISFFERGTAGVIARNMQQAERIRQFLTGRLFMTMLDASVLVVVLPILFFYAPPLAALVLGFTLAIALIVAALVPPFRRRLNALLAVEGERQALLVESIQGMRAIKSLAAEGLRQGRWEQRSEEAVDLHFRVGRLSAGAHSAVTLMEKLMQVGVIAFGARLVIDHQLSVGALIAFQMLAGRVISPLVQMISLIHEYQETALSVKLLGQIMDAPRERVRSGPGLEPVIKGRIEFDDVTFRYPGSSSAALERISFTIPAGKVVGVVGRSGSGKTTLTRILQGLHEVQEGVVRIDGIDIREIDIRHLRRSLGVVLQDSFLFRGTVRENIAIAQPDAPVEAVVEAARMAGADEFIERLPQGYETPLDEGASNLSGGQRQRLAIARALLPQPRILVLDEAASSLDPESEAIFLDNLSRIAKGRTVIIVSHRMSTLVGADAIMVMQRGRIVDAGKHAELLPRCEIYARLWQQQTRHL